MCTEGRHLPHHCGSLGRPPAREGNGAAINRVRIPTSKIIEIRDRSFFDVFDRLDPSVRGPFFSVRTILKKWENFLQI